MNYKEFIQKYEELLNSGYCECNELNCLDNNPPKKILNIMKEQQQEIERLNKELEVAKTNEETYKLEMLDITKRLGLDEETLFDDVKDKVEKLKEENLLLRASEPMSKLQEDYGYKSEVERLNNIINELEHHLYQEWLEWKDSDCESIYSRAGEDKAIYDYLQELKESDSNE